MRQAHFTTDDSLVKAGHRFLASVLASYDFDLLRRDDDPDPLDEFRRYEDEEQTEALLTLAAIARISDDELKTLGTAKAAFPNGVGYLEQHGARTTLSIREACNKIIHAEKAWYDLAWTSQNPLWAMWYVAQGHEVSGKFKAPALMLEGTHSGKPWAARVELIPFVIATSMWNVGKWNFSGRK